LGCYETTGEESGRWPDAGVRASDGIHRRGGADAGDTVSGDIVSGNIRKNSFPRIIFAGD